MVLSVDEKAQIVAIERALSYLLVAVLKASKNPQVALDDFVSSMKTEAKTCDQGAIDEPEHFEVLFAIEMALISLTKKLTEGIKIGG